jgi:hypothetical protein
VNYLVVKQLREMADKLKDYSGVPAQPKKPEE